MQGIGGDVATDSELLLLRISLTFNAIDTLAVHSL